MGPVQTSDPHTADVTKVGRYKGRTYTFRTGTNVGPTHIGRYKGRTVQTTDLHTSDWYKRRTGTNVGPVQTSDRYINKE